VIRKLEVLANVAVIITSVVVCTTLVRRYVLPSRGGTAAARTAVTSTNTAPLRPPSITNGTAISLPSVDWSESNRTLVLALSTACHFCSESAPLYRKLVEGKRGDMRLIALLPQPVSGSRTYLESLGVNIPEVVQSPLAGVGVSGTPTLLLIDNRGFVIDSWVGKLSDSAAEEVLAQVVK